MNISDQAELMARGLDIPPASYAGRQADAIVAMAILDGYRQLEPADQAQVLLTIRDRMHFGETNPAFFFACQQAVVMMTANPTWVPASLSNDELEAEIGRWKQTSAVLSWLGFGTGGKLARNVLDNPAKALRGLAKPTPAAAMLAFGTAAQIVATASLRDLQAEAARRGMLRTMTPLHALEASR